MNFKMISRSASRISDRQTSKFGCSQETWEIQQRKSEFKLDFYHKVRMSKLFDLLQQLKKELKSNVRSLRSNKIEER